MLTVKQTIKVMKLERWIREGKIKIVRKWPVHFLNKEMEKFLSNKYKYKEQPYRFSLCGRSPKNKNFKITTDIKEVECKLCLKIIKFRKIKR